MYCIIQSLHLTSTLLQKTNLCFHLRCTGKHKKTTSVPRKLLILQDSENSKALLKSTTPQQLSAVVQSYTTQPALYNSLFRFTETYYQFTMHCFIYLNIGINIFDPFYNRILILHIQFIPRSD